MGETQTRGVFMSDAVIRLDLKPPVTNNISNIIRDLNTREAAAYLSISTAQLEKWRHFGGGPAFLRYGRKCIRYRISDLDAFRDQARMEAV